MHTLIKNVYCHVLSLTVACITSKHWDCYFLEIPLSENMVSVYM